MSYKYIDMSTYKRKSHFDYFNKLAIPHVGVTVNIDITDFLKVLKKINVLSFYRYVIA